MRKGFFERSNIINQIIEQCPPIYHVRIQTLIANWHDDELYCFNTCLAILQKEEAGSSYMLKQQLLAKICTYEHTDTQVKFIYLILHLLSFYKPGFNVIMTSLAQWPDKLDALYDTIIFVCNSHPGQADALMQRIHQVNLDKSVICLEQLHTVFTLFSRHEVDAKKLLESLPKLTNADIKQLHGGLEATTADQTALAIRLNELLESPDAFSRHGRPKAEPSFPQLR